MVFQNIRIAASALLIAAFTALATPAGAQIKFEFGQNEQLLVASLQSRGFSEIQIISNEFFQVRVEACKDGARYRFKWRIDGQIVDMRKIGSCGAVTAQRITEILQQAGYNEVEVFPRDNGFVAFGCRDGGRFRMIMQPDGKIAHTKKVGSCRAELSRGEVAALLRKQGFEEVDFQQSGPSGHVVHACLGQAKFELVVNPQGEIESESRIGLCGRGIDPADIPAVLAERGFTRIEIIDDQLPRYVAVACKDGKRVEVTLNRFGKVIKTKRLGRCAKRLSQDEITEILAGRGFLRINVIKAESGGYTIDACYKGRVLRMKFSVYGDFISERDRGACQSRRVSEILDDLRNRNVRDLEVYVEGCRNNRRVRFPIDELGDRGKRERVGNC